MTELFQQISDLIAGSERDLDRIVRTHTDGYACAHAIEAEQLRLRKRLEETALALGRSPSPQRVGELAGLGEGLARTGVELTELRGALVELAAKARRLRAA